MFRAAAIAVIALMTAPGVIAAELVIG